MNPRASSNTTQAPASFAALQNELRGLLRSAQNSDGAWAFHRGGGSRVEPTSWAVRALTDGSKEVAHQKDLTRAIEYLRRKQLADGSWPANDGMESGGWVTSLACGVLADYEEQSRPADNRNAREIQNALQAGLQWLCDDYPRDSGGWQKFLKKLRPNKNFVEQSDEFRGWGWTPRTSSWVEPTAFALMALTYAETGTPPALEKAIAERRKLAIGLLYDRMCPRGGWNCGNPRVYGVDGDPLVLPTCWALLALRDEPEHVNRSLSLAWLRNEFGKIESAGSLAMARITLESYGMALPEAKRSLLEWSGDELAEQGMHVAAWVSLALNPERAWPQSCILPVGRAE
jgi:hypothetical protein